jgi:hypothetical protein
MLHEDSATVPTPSLTTIGTDRMKAILGMLKQVQPAWRISSVLVGHRALVRRSGECGESARPAGPCSHVFGAEDLDILTTDGQDYWFARGFTTLR